MPANAVRFAYQSLMRFGLLLRASGAQNEVSEMENRLEACDALTPRKTFLAGVIYFDQRKQTVKCIIRELSVEGASLVCQDTTAIPTKTIELYIPSQNEFFPADVRERTGSELRVAFKQIHDSALPAGGTSEVFRRLHLLETEVAHLRRTVEELKDARARQADLGI